jgi:hypothetical protein
MRRLPWFALKVVALTLPLTWLWVNGGRAWYGWSLAPVADAIYALLGLDGVTFFPRDRYINQVPFAALMLLTPGLSLRRRIGGLALGAIAIFAVQMLVNAIALRGESGATSLPAGLSVLCDAAPFVLWAAIARDFVARFAERDTIGSGGEP